MVVTPSSLILSAHGKSHLVSIRRFLGRLVAETVRQSDPSRLETPMPPASDVNVLSFDTAAQATLQALADAITDAVGALQFFRTADLPVASGSVKTTEQSPIPFNFGSGYALKVTELDAGGNAITYPLYSNGALKVVLCDSNGSPLSMSADASANLNVKAN